MRMIWFLGAMLFWGGIALADAPTRKPPIFNTTYSGAYQANFTSHAERVRLLTRQGQLEISSKLGLIQYAEGFRYPMTIRFEDEVPNGLENTLAYVRYAQNGLEFEQELVVNLRALSTHPMDFDTVFYHEMTHAVMNDAVGGAATFKIPRWLQEGLAVYASGEGDNRVQKAAEGLRRSEVDELLFDLNGPVYGNAYPQYYLAIKYLIDKHSINMVQALVRNLITGQAFTPALQDATGMDWKTYQKNVRDYSYKTFRDIAIPDNSTRY